MELRERSAAHGLLPCRTLQIFAVAMLLDWQDCWAELGMAGAVVTAALALCASPRRAVTSVARRMAARDCF